MPFNPEKMYKLPPGERFVDLNEIWYFANRWAVRFLYPLPVTANQITVLSLISGMAAGVCFFLEGSQYLIWGAVFLYGKIFLDNVDGNLARVRREESRYGRFLDSLTDFAVSALVYAGITYRLVMETGNGFLALLGSLAFLSCLLHCAYFVFYLVNYTSSVGSYLKNRVDEKVTEEDLKDVEEGRVSRTVYTLQRLHHWVYGWQDSAAARLDAFSRARARVGENQKDRDSWYRDKRFLTLISPLCLCTNNVALVIFALADQLEFGLGLIVFGGSVYLAGCQVWKIMRVRRASAPFSNGAA